MSGFAQKIYHSLLTYETRLWLYKCRHQKEYKKLRTIVHPSPKGDFSLKPFDENKCIFIHVTKAAGTSVAKSLFGYLPYHYTALDYRVIYGKRLFGEYFKFAFVRNPWDRLYSAYRYLKAGGWNSDDRIWAENNLRAYDSFDNFIKQWLSSENINQHIHFWPQSRFICDSHNRLLIDYLAYFETINDDYNLIRSKLGIGEDISQQNVNPGDSYKNVYTTATRDIVARVYADDIEICGYEFEGINRRTQINNSR